ncbi:MAG: pyruvate kinase alpha/beta domain-containing protein [Desulfobacterales bacterium]|nr:pyruvate kinase alpha/beta domain-containing protein [Desulfobacterales bacterium]
MYFDTAGQVNTAQTLRAAAERGRALGLDEIVLATTSGDTAYKALEQCAGFNLVAVTYHCGFKTPFENVLPEKVRQDLASRGVRVVTATHALSGVERGLSKKHAGLYPVVLMADTLKLFGQGTKVAVEVAVMAADAGALSGRDSIAVGGSSRGADTALVLKPAHAARVFDLKIREIVCKPRDF